MEKFESGKIEENKVGATKALDSEEKLEDGKSLEGILGLRTNQKGWEKYWINRLATEEDAPEDVRAIAGKLKLVKKVSYEEHQILQKYVARLIRASAKAGKLEELLSKRVVVVEKVVSKAESELAVFLKRIDKANQEMIGIGKLNIVSEQEKRDLEMNFQKKEAVNYWANRFLLEGNLLPREVQESVAIYLYGDPFSKASCARDIKAYAIKRLAVLKFNVEKRLIMAQFKKNLRAIDKREDYPEVELKNRKVIFYDENDDRLFVKINEKKKYISLGDIAGDYIWGLKYAPDKSLPESLWRRVRKIADLTEARDRIETIFNQELSNIYNVPLGSQGMTVKYLEKHPELGMIAEKAVMSFLERLQYNHPELNFKVESSNALEDTILKYDFKIFIPEKVRGVALQGNDLLREDYVKEKVKIGIQFTISVREDLQRRKKEQLEKARKDVTDDKFKRFVKREVDDIVLVTIPLQNFKFYFQRWLKAGRPPGGPERYLSISERKRIFKDIFANLIDFDMAMLEAKVE